ncbi:MAG: insulinase family protein [Caulobacteraceae bacterium]|nr:insulinase family protein [Caulobacteraceae bacterium]
MKSRLFAAASIAALMLGVSACATTSHSDATINAATAAARAAADAAAAAEVQSRPVVVPPLGFRERALANGLRVFTARDTSTSNVTIQVWYKVGSKDDPQDRSGFAHLFEHLMFKATENFPDETFDRLTEDVGGNNNAFTSDDVTAYHETVPANHLERLIFAEADRLGSLVVNESVFESERDVVKEEYRQGVLASPYGRLFSLFVPATIYQEHPYRRSTIGSIENLDAATIEDVRRFHATYYRPDNAYLIVSGNFDQAQLDGWIDRYFGPLTNPDRPLPANDVREPEPTGPREATFHAPNVPLPAVVLAWPTVRYDHPDRAALTVLDGILSTGESSRLYRSLVYDQQLTSQTSSSLDASQQAGALTAYAIMAEGRTPEEGLAALRAEAARLRDTPVTEAELAEARNELVASALRQRETVEDRANVLGWSLINTGDAAAADREIADLQAVTAADIQRVAQRYLTNQRSIAIRYLNADEANPVTVQAVDVTAPVRVADLAPVGRIFELLPEGRRQPMPQPGTAVEPATPAIQTFTLDSGLEVFVARKPGLPLVSARLSLPAGSAHDPSGKAGVANMTAALLTQGADGRSAPEIAAQIEQLGADIGANPGPDFTTVYANAPADVFPQAMEILADLALRPDFAVEELERQRDQALDGLRIQLSSPGPVGTATVARVIFGNAPYGAPGGGTLNSLPTRTREDVAAFHAGRYSPAGAKLVFSGDITVEEARFLAERAFGDWRAAATAPEVAARAGAAAPPRVVVIDQPGAGQAAVFVARRSIARDDADYFPLTLGNTLLGGSFTSRLNQEIRIKRGLSYGTRSGLGVRLDTGAFTASAQTRNDAAVEVAGLILAELTRLATTRPTESEMTTRQAILTGAFGSSLETVDGLGSLVAGLALYDLPMSDLAAYAGRVRAITPEQVQAAFARHLPASDASLVIVGDASTFIEALRARYPNVEVIPLTGLNLDSATLR